MSDYYENGMPVRAVDPVYPGDGAETSEVDEERFKRQVLQRLLSWLCVAKSPEGIGRKVLLAAHLVKAYNAPRSQRQLGSVMNLSAARVNTILREFRNEFEDFCGSE